MYIRRSKTSGLAIIPSKLKEKTKEKTRNKRKEMKAKCLKPRKLHLEEPLARFLIFCFLLNFAIVSSDDAEEEVGRSDFPENFLFGTATSSHQIEGGYLEDGKGLSNWDVFSHIPGKTWKNETADVADDHYHRFLEDIEMMHSLGANAYRVSISWSRILPKGRFGQVNPKGLKFYDDLIDNLLLKGIEPFVTIFHHEYPQELLDRYGGWISPQMAEDFVLLAETCFKHFGDRVKYWTTLNEPNLLTDFSYIRGIYPPQHCSQPFGNCSVGNSDLEPLIVLHNMIIAHGKAVKLYRQNYQANQGGSIGIVACAFMYVPLRNNELDQLATKRAFDFNIGWLLDPLAFGDYPAEMRRYHGSELPTFSEEEKECVKGSFDFIGINHYSTLYAKDCTQSSCNLGGDRPIRGFVYTTGVRDGVMIGDPTGMPRFYVVPWGLEKVIEYLKRKYDNPPMFVTENGYCSISEEGERMNTLVHDAKRVRYHKDYLAALSRAVRDGADVRGYFIWSLMDNFEWTAGYSKKFGIFYVDRRSLRRFPKLSAKWFKHFLANEYLNLVNSSDVIDMTSEI